ncbi:HRDC domain-containing protein, partial [Corallococcus sp. 4LFB]|uniref:HRDC domain-containing protein n=1 Tax=Corallococcus sp. 4LFB TaxID=3383249 RepID=UPI003976FE69
RRRRGLPPGSLPHGRTPCGPERLAGTQPVRAVAGPGPRASWNASRNAPPEPGYPAPPASPALVESLKAWRLTEARKRKVPAFRILTDRVLDAIASARPSSGAELMSIHGVGPTLTERYGPQILSLVSRR